MDAQLSLKFSENEMQSCLQFVPFSTGDPSAKQPVPSMTARGLDTSFSCMTFSWGKKCIAAHGIAWEALCKAQVGALETKILLQIQS